MPSTKILAIRSGSGALLALTLLLNTAHAETGSATAQHASSSKDEAPAPSADCAHFYADINADLKAEMKAGCKPTEAQIGQLMNNPVGNLVMFPLQNDYTRVKGGPIGNYKDVNRTQFIPTFPIKLNDDWNLINRISIPIVSEPVNKHIGGLFGDTPQQIAQDPKTQSIINDPFSRTTGLGDITYVGLVAPSQGKKLGGDGVLIWGVGGTLMVPTASEAVQGTGKYSAGPSAVLAYMGPEWILGIFPQQWWSFASSKKDRPSVNMTNIQYFIQKKLDDAGKWHIGMTPNISINWNAKGGGNKVNLPVGLGINYTTKLAGIPIKYGFEVQYSVIQQSSMPGARWNYRFVILPAIPKFLL
ncbi:hypothetical protein [Dyella silvae]|uniref:hypothetical protein n=1 Tax=Dyella silvae TaxID=2994424 RepID=UPI002264A37A|nr:hypothetical protein [Dyella silvae]